MPFMEQNTQKFRACCIALTPPSGLYFAKLFPIPLLLRYYLNEKIHKITNYVPKKVTSTLRLYTSNRINSETRVSGWYIHQSYCHVAWPSKADFYTQEYIFHWFFFREWKWQRGRGETDWLPSACSPAKPGMEPKIQVPGLDLKSNPWPFNAQADALTT